MTTQEAAQEAIEKWAASKHLKFSDKNAHLLGVWIKANGLEFTVDNLERAVVDPHFRFSLEFESGFEPKASPEPVVPRPRAKDPFNAMIDGGAGAPFRAYTHADKMADEARARKDAGRQREAAIAKQKEAEQARQQHAAENQLIYRESGPYAGQVDWPATFGAREAAKKKRAQSDTRSAMPAEIPAGTTDFRPYSSEQIWRYQQRETNRYAIKNR